ncbi:RNA binding protein, partial [Oryctes borbonicus]
YGRVQSVKLLPRSAKDETTSEGATACTVAFMDIKSAAKAHVTEHKIDDRTLTTEYYEPAAIPSAASPQNTTSAYSTSPGTNRFPNGHGSTDDHASFSERFYDRNTNRVPDAEYLRRSSGYHENNRGRNRDRGYRNGPYNAVLDRTHRVNSGTTWTAYDATTRYNNQNSDTGYSTAPSENSDRRTEQSTKKKTKSRSGSRSPSPSGSTSSRSPSRSRSRSSSSSSSSSTSRATSSTGSPKSRRAPAGNQYQSAVHSEDRRPLAICVRNLPCRSSDTSLKDGLFHEYKKHGKVTWVKVVGQSSERHAIVCFKKPEDVEKALEVSYDKLFFGSKIEVAPYQGHELDDNDSRLFEAEIDEFHPRATRTLFIGNLEKDVTASDLRKEFDQFGEIIEIDIKKQGVVSSYAFCQYSDIVSVVKAIRTLDGEHLGNNRIKLGFGKSMPTSCVWVDGVSESVSEKYLKLQFEGFGTVPQVSIDREKGQALVFYDQVPNAQLAVKDMRGTPVKGRKIQVDFASRECQEAFYDHLEKQGHAAERIGNFEERRDSTSRTFEAITTSTRFSRYDTPTRPRTSSYSSRSSATTSQCNASAIPSPGTPGSATPRGSGSRSRVPRYAPEYYDQNSEYTDQRHFRNYDEYSQGSAASHEDNYEHEYVYHESPSHLETLDRLQTTSDHPVTFPQPDIRNLQKERVHLLEQLEEYPSSGDELISPKKKLKLDHLDGAIISDVIIEANRDHRKVMEVRRLSDTTNTKHHSRRPSVDGKYRDLTHDRGSYLPHAVCKRRKTGGSDNGSRVHHYDQSGSESVGGSRPGTPLCDERPEHIPTEPRRTPREREGPLSLPLPRFAAQVLHKGSISVAGIKGQKDNILSSPPAAATSPRISNPKPPSPVHVPPPASPPPRPPSLSSTSSDSDIAPHSPSLDERIRSLDEKYEKWSGSRALSAAGGDALLKLDANREKFKFKHKLLDLDLKEVQPSEIVKSVMAKRSVFDEDTKRLENVGEKYEPKEFNSFPKTPAPVQPTVPATPPLAAPASTLKVSTTPLPKTPTMLSPRSTGTCDISGTGITPAKGLQYPFPSHPPPLVVVATTAPMTTTVITLSSAIPNTLSSSAGTTSVTNISSSTINTATPTMTTTTVSSPSSVQLVTAVQNLPLAAVPSAALSLGASTVANRVNHGDNRLKPCVGGSVSSSVNNSNNSSTSGDNSRTSSKVCSVNRSVTNNNNINNNNSAVGSSNCQKSSDTIRNMNNNNINNIPQSVAVVTDVVVNAQDTTVPKSSKSGRESKTSNNEKTSSTKNSSSDSKSRRNSDTSTRKTENDSDKHYAGESSCDSAETLRIRDERDRLEKERMEAEKLRIEKEIQEERERQERERQERERERQEKIEKERLERERIEKVRLENLKREREEREKREKEERERKEREEREERERRERKEREERERREKEREEREKREREREERERKEKEERERREEEKRERREREEREERERREREEGERMEKEKRKEEERRHKDDNHEKRKDDYRHRDIHPDNRYTNHDSNKSDGKNAKDDKKDELALSKRDHDSRFHENRESKNRHHDRDSDKRKEGTKENRETNSYDKLKNSEIRENKDITRISLETRHLSIDLEKNRQSDTSNKADPSRRKERNNSLPVNVGNKRRLSCHESTEIVDEPKKIKLSQDHKKVSERRNSKDATSREEKIKSKHKSSSNSSKHEDKSGRSDKHNNISHDEKRKEREEKHKNKQKEKQKSKSKNRDKESPSTPNLIGKDISIEKDYLARLEAAESEKLKRKELKDKKKQDSESEERRSDDSKRLDDLKSKDKFSSSDRIKRDEQLKSDDRKNQKKDRIRKITNSSDNSDSDEPKKHSIFDIVDDEPAYISMYDKVKARSCKNMQKQEEEKRQEKIKAKFSQLKQSRAKREEKKRSTSWDEDSDSEKECKTKKGNKMLIRSSDEEDNTRKIQRRKEIYSDSDSERNTVAKHCSNIDSSDDDHIKNSNLQRKGSKSRIASDTSDDEFKLAATKHEIISDNEDQPNMYDFDENLFNKIKEDEPDESKHIKKEKKNSKHQTMKYFGSDASSGDEMVERKEKTEGRKKHKKKQKKQKNSISSEDAKLESISESLQNEAYEKPKNSEKKKQHSKKDKKRDKSKDENREKSKKSKKTKESKRDGKIENIFGSLSDDSETGTKEQISNDHKHFHMACVNEDIQSMYASDSDGIPSSLNVSKEAYKSEERERSMKEEHRKRKEKKRREKEKQRKREEVNDNSIDFIDLGKQLEENIKDDSNEGVVKLEGDEVKTEHSEDGFIFSALAEVAELKKEDRKENREKKKKRKKNKEEKQRHHHHHDKSKNKSPESKKETNKVPSPTPLSSTPTDIEIKSEIEKQGQSLPNILDIPSPPQNKSSSNLDVSISPIIGEPIISPIPKAPICAKEKKREKFIPGFGSEIDEKIHESAVKSISEFEQPKQEQNEVLSEDVIKGEKTENGDEKPRVVISQEETEDAVAALLGESFGSGQFEDCYSEQQLSPINSDQVASISDENNVQDDEEMRQAVRSLNSTDLDMKPDTPQSEHELQIDTDTEEQEEVSLRYDHPPKTPDTVDLSQRPKTPDISNCLENEEPPQHQPQPQLQKPLLYKTANIGSPPSLTPIKQEPKNIVPSPLPASLPILSEQRSVISKSWVDDQKDEISEISVENSKKLEEPLPPLAIQSSQFTSVAKISNSARPFTSVPPLKVPEPVLAEATKQTDKQLKPESPKIPSNISVLHAIKAPVHNVPPHIPYPIPTQKLPNEATLVSPKLATSISRLPITSVQVVSTKPIQSTTLVLPQPKQAQASESLKLITTERPRMIYQGTPTLQQLTANFGPRMMQRCGLPPQGILLPNKTSYTAMRLSVKGSTVIERPLTEPPKLVPTSSPLAPQTFDIQQSQAFAQIRSQPQSFSQNNQQSVQQAVQVTQSSFTSLPLTFQTASPIIVSSNSNMIKPLTVDTIPTTTTTVDIKTFTPVIQEAPKLVANIPKSEIRSPQPAVIQQAPPKPSTPIQQNVDTPETPPILPSAIDSVKESNIRTSTPSPVIVANIPAKIETPVKVETPSEIIDKTPPTKPVEVQLAIEKVTEELNLSLEKESMKKTEEQTEMKEEKPELLETESKDNIKKEEIKEEVDMKLENSEEVKIEKVVDSEPVKTEPEGISVIKEIEKIDEEKADTDSVVSDISKERLSAEILSKDDPLDSKEDSDYWSAKEVNIESVIKTVDALCSADDLSDRSSELGKDEWFDENKMPSVKSDEKSDAQSESSDKKDIENDATSITNDSYYDGIENVEEKEVTLRVGGKRGGRPRGSRKNRTVVRVGVQTRRAKIKEATSAKRGGRGGRPKNERKCAKAELESCADVYEFRDDSDDAKDRPRLILTIKQQAPNSANGNPQQTAILKEVPKSSVPPPTPPKVVEAKEEFTSPVSNTRKSRRLQEKDASRNTVDDTIEDVVKNTMVTRSCTAMAQGEGGPRRSTRQSVAKPQPETPRKSPRGAKKKDRRASETTDDSSEEKVVKPEPVVKNEPSPRPSPVKEEPPKEIKPEVKQVEVEEPKEKPREKPHEGLKATVLRRVKGEMNQEPMTLIDPVTGLLTPMRECEEGKYIPISGSQSNAHTVITTSTPVITQSSAVVSSTFPKTSESDPVVTSSVVVKTSKPQSFKAHVLSSQAAKAVVSQQMQPQKPVTSQSLPQPTFTPNSMNQHLNINISSVPSYVSPHLSPRPVQTKPPIHTVKIVPSTQLSPNHQLTILQKPSAQQQQQPQHKIINPVIQSPIVNPQMAHIKQPPVVKQPAILKQAPTLVKQPQIANHPSQPSLVLNKSGMMVKHPVHQQPVIGVTGRVAQTGAANKLGVDPPKVEVSMAGCVMVPRSNVSPQNQPRHVLQAGIPVPAYEASLGEAMGAHFPPGSVQLRPPHDLPANHYLHASHVVYHQFLRQYLPRSPMVSMEKSSDGQEGEEAPVTSPPMELRRPGSVGLALSGRSNAVPHSLQSPHDRTTDSPQVYAIHSNRVQHYNTRYYDEPPPAHRPVTSHGSLAALGNDRSLSHMGGLGTPDRPLSAHSVGHLGGIGTPDRSMTTHLPERPLSGHGLALGAGLGAAGNLMGAVARHVGADAPASQRGIQAATPPHASQVPAQAESLLMLLKQYPCMWQGLLALKNDQAAVQMYFVSGNDAVAKCSLPKNSDGSTPPLRIFQRMRLEPPQVEGVARKMQMENEHCMLLALPCGHDHMDVLKQSTNLNNGFITYLQQKQAAGIVNVAAPGTTQPPAYVVHIFPSCDFVNENLRRIAPSLLERVADIAHLLIVITTV